MKILIFTLLIIHCSLVFANAQWVLQSSGTKQTLRSVYFVNKHTGWTIGDKGTILKSENGGIKWTKYKNSSIKANLNGVYFVNKKTGWCVGDSGVILKTINKGITWFRQHSGSSNLINSIFFVNSHTGWCVGDNLVLKTTNAGTNWLIQTGFDTINYYSVNFNNVNSGWICGDRGTIYKTTNGGINWLNKSILYHELHSIYFVNDLSGWVAGSTYTLEKTTDGGNNWFGLWGEKSCLEENNIKSPPAIYTSVYFINQNTGWFTIDHAFGGEVDKTTDCGVNWFEDYPMTRNQRLQSVYFVNHIIGWAVGENGTILKANYNNNDDSYIATNTNNNNYLLSQNYPNPFNPITNIRYEIPKNSFVNLVVYDALGRELEILVNENLTVGTYEATFNASHYPSGVYFYRLTTDNFSETKKMILMK